MSKEASSLPCSSPPTAVLAPARPGHVSLRLTFELRSLSRRGALELSELDGLGARPDPVGATYAVVTGNGSGFGMDRGPYIGTGW